MVACFGVLGAIGKPVQLDWLAPPPKLAWQPSLAIVAGPAYGLSWLGLAWPGWLSWLGWLE